MYVCMYVYIIYVYKFMHVQKCHNYVNASLIHNNYIML